MKNILISLLSVAVFTISPVESDAVTITQLFTDLPDAIPNTYVPTGTTVYPATFNKFDPSLGTLTAVRWTIYSALSADVTLFNSDSAGSHSAYDFRVFLDSNISGIPISGGTAGYTTTIGSGLQDNNGSGWTLAPQTGFTVEDVPASNWQQFASFTSLGDLASYVGLGTFDVGLQADGRVSTNANTWIVFTPVSYFGDVLKLEYDYDSSTVPEPGTMMLMGSGLLMFGGRAAARFRRKQIA